MGERELFVWYRVKGEHRDAALAAVAAMQASLVAAWPGLQARLLVRDEAPAATWMETYARRAPATRTGIDAAIEAAIATGATALAPLLDGERHVEAFEVVDRS